VNKSILSTQNVNIVHKYGVGGVLCLVFIFVVEETRLSVSPSPSPSPKLVILHKNANTMSNYLIKMLKRMARVRMERGYRFDENSFFTLSDDIIVGGLVFD
jgi:hypothetical protein